MDWKRFFDSLGMNGTRWQWRIMKWERDVRSFLRGESSSGGISVTKIIIGVNLLLFAVMVIWASIFSQGMSALFSPNTLLLRLFGGQYWPYVLQADQWWRCITYAYTHGGIIHLAFNMVVLYQVGPMIERGIGPARFFILYTLAAITATLAGFIWHPGVTVIGASGSLFGLIGFAIVYCHRMGEAGIMMRNFMLKWAAFAFIFGLLVGADNAGHLGGAIGGALFGLVLPIGVRVLQAGRRIANTFAVIAVLATVGSIGSLVLFWIAVYLDVAKNG